MPPPPPSAVPSPASQGRIGVEPLRPYILPCEAGEGDHAKHGGGGMDGGAPEATEEALRV